MYNNKNSLWRAQILLFRNININTQAFFNNHNQNENSKFNFGYNLNNAFIGIWSY